MRRVDRFGAAAPEATRWQEASVFDYRNPDDSATSFNMLPESGDGTLISAAPCLHKVGAID